MEPASGKEKAKVGRRRIACMACSSNKQKCDGATRHPCRRCELYGVLCEYPDGKVPKSAVRVATGLHSDPNPSGTSNGETGAVTRRAASSDPGPLVHESPATDTATLLREIRERLVAIETGLENDRRHGLRATPPLPSLPSTAPSLLLPAASPRSENQRPLAPASTHSDAAAHALEQMDMPHDSNPLQVLVATLDEVERLNRGDNAMDEERDSEERGSAPGTESGGIEDPARTDRMTEEEQLVYQAKRTPRSNRPDVFSRGLMSVEDIELAFAFYRQRIQPWLPDAEDRSPLRVRAKSPFLFHAILLVTDYYNTSTSPRAVDVYTGLTTIIHELVAGTIFAPDPSLFNSDLVRGLLLLLYYKPVQTTLFQQRGLKTNSRIAHVSKINALSSLMIHCLLQRTASFLNLQQSPAMLSMHFDNPEGAAKAGIPPYEQVLADYRLWVLLIAVDNLGSLQSGRAGWADPSSALRVGRKFAGLQGHPTDVRRIAILELYSIIAVPPSAAAATRPVRYRLERLPTINKELEQWRAHWKPLLDEAQQKGDPLAYTVERCLACFVSLSVNGGTFSRWAIERQKELEEGKEGRPNLTQEDWIQLQVAADAAQSAIYAVSLDARDMFKPLRGEDWPRVNGSQRESLRLSLSVAEDYKTALDTITCIAFAYSLLFLVRMSSAGLISCNIVTRQAEYESGANLGVPQPLTSGDKLPLLLELGSKFLYAISPSIDHPSQKHAVLLQTILKVGSGQPFSPTLQQTASTPQAIPVPSAFTRKDPALPVVQSFAPRPDSDSLYPGIGDTTSSLATSTGAPAFEQTNQPHYNSWTWNSKSDSNAASNGAGEARLDHLVIPSTSIDTTLNAGVSREGGDEDPAQAMASLLASSNFIGEFYATQPNLNANAFNDDFGLTNAVPDLNSADWTNIGDLGVMSGSNWMNL
ncbi:uncharacterized protein JCM15063_000204 [Sporobolomyces koalae]|uniref:uncharacterized protein n=1 Tax=Sporobolomyces koalae TaxID=500713 RepID=UPI00317E0327